MVVSQLTFNALVTASLIFPLALGFSLVYRVCGFIHFAHGFVYVAGAYGALYTSKVFGAGWGGCCLGALLSASSVGVAIEWLCYRPLRRRGASSLVLLMASLGIFVIGENAFALSFGDSSRSIHGYRVSEGIEILGAVATQGQMVAIVLAVLTGLLLQLALEGSAFGNRLRACAQSRALAIAHGINSQNYLLLSGLIASALAGLAAFQTVLDSDITPTMGLSPLMYAIVAALIGGAGRVRDVATGACLLAGFLTAASWFFGSQWEQAAAFGVVVGFLSISAGSARWKAGVRAMRRRT